MHEEDYVSSMCYIPGNCWSGQRTTRYATVGICWVGTYMYVDGQRLPVTFWNKPKLSHYTQFLCKWRWLVLVKYRTDNMSVCLDYIIHVVQCQFLSVTFDSFLYNAGQQGGDLKVQHHNISATESLWAVPSCGQLLLSAPGHLPGIITMCCHGFLKFMCVWGGGAGVGDQLWSMVDFSLSSQLDLSYLLCQSFPCMNCTNLSIVNTRGDGSNLPD